MNVLVAYDIHDDGRRARVAARLATIGARLQRSVFECVVSHDEFELLAADLARLVDENVDVLQMFAQCADCCEKRHNIGQVDLSLEELFWIV